MKIDKFVTPKQGQPKNNLPINSGMVSTSELGQESLTQEIADCEFLFDVTDKCMSLSPTTPTSDLISTARHIIEYLHLLKFSVYSLNQKQRELAHWCTLSDNGWLKNVSTPVQATGFSELVNRLKAISSLEQNTSDAIHNILSPTAPALPATKTYYIPIGQAESLNGFIAVTIDTASTKQSQREFELWSQVGEILYSSLAICHEQMDVINYTEELSEILNYSQSIYSCWNIGSGWSYVNTNRSRIIPNSSEKNDQNETNTSPLCGLPVHPEDLQEAKNLFYECLETGLDYQYDYRIVDEGEVQCWHQASVHVVEKDSTGKATRLISTAHDITEIKNAENKSQLLADSEKWLVSHTNALFNSSDLDGIERALLEVANYLDSARCSVRIRDPENGEWKFIAQWTSQKMPPALDVRVPSNKNLLVSLTTALEELGCGKIINDNLVEEDNPEVLDFHKRGGVRSYIIQPMFFEDRLTGYLAILCDRPRKWTLLEQRAAKVSAEAIHMVLTRLHLIESYTSIEERLQLAMNVSNYGVWEHHTETGDMYLSPNYYRMLGYEPDEISSSEKTVDSLIHPDDFKETRKKIEQQYADKEGVISIESRHITKSGESRWIQTKGKVVKRNPDGSPALVMGANADITELKNTLEELEVARGHAESANHAKSEFLARMSHEIRTPMNAIIGLAYLCLQEPLSSEQQSYLQDVESAANSLLQVIDDILDFSKIEAGKLTIEYKDFDLICELERIIKLMALRAEQRGLTLDFKTAQGVPDRVIGDQTRLGQIVTNLLSNAIKFTTKGRISLTVEPAEIDENTDTILLLFAVSDSGIGLEPHQIENLFEPFMQAEGSTARKYGGTGLGLSISKHLVEMMGGSINVISKPSVGTTFHFSIVFKKSSISQSNSNRVVQSPLKDVEQYRRTLAGKKALLVEDNLVNQKVAQGFLGRVNIDVTIANNGEEALAVLRDPQSHPFDVILMDIEMPILDGFNTTRAIRSDPSMNTIPVIAMTAHAMKGDREKCLASGMNDHIAKPIKPEVLFQVLNKFIG